MPSGDGHGIAAITAAKRGCEGDSPVSARGGNKPVARQQTGVCQRQSTEAIIDMRIDTGLKQHQIRREAVKAVRQRIGQHRRIFGITRSVRQLDIPRRPRFSHRKIPRGMHGKREGIIPSGKQAGGPVPLVHIEVNDHDPPHIAFRQQPMGRNGQIIEYAVTGTAAGHCMMAAAGAVRCKAVPKSQFCRQPGTTRRQLGSPRDALANRKTDAALDFGINGRSDDRIHIVRIVHGSDPVPWHQIG